jgi:sRNA-binding carbon storage regulator CsrA
LVLNRYEGESVVLDGGRIKVTVVGIKSGGKVKLGFSAGLDVRIDREEVHNERLRAALPRPGEEGGAACGQ